MMVNSPFDEYQLMWRFVDQLVAANAPILGRIVGLSIVHQITFFRQQDPAPVEMGWATTRRT